MMQEVMCQVVADVAKDATAEDCGCNIPIPVEHEVRKPVERCRKYNEQGRRHDQTKLVHRQIMMDTMEQKMRGDTYTVVWEVSVTRSQLYGSSNKDTWLTCLRGTSLYVIHTPRASITQDLSTSMRRSERTMAGVDVQGKCRIQPVVATQ